MTARRQRAAETVAASAMIEAQRVAAGLAPLPYKKKRRSAPRLSPVPLVNVPAARAF